MRKEKGYAILIVFIAVIVTVIMIRLGKKNPKSKPQMKAPAVRIERVSPESIQADIMATALIEANQSLNITPEISGRVSWISPRFINGGFVKKGEVLLKLDARDASLAVKQFEVNVESAKLALEQEKARGEIAKEEWQTLGEDSDASDMVLRGPQLRVAELNLLSAKSALEKANLALSRTKIRAPFNSTISNKVASVGQMVSPQVPLAKLLEVGKMRAELTIPVDQIPWIDIPGVEGAKKGSEVILIQNIGKDNVIERVGKVSALIGEIGLQTRRAKLNISIPPYKGDGLPLLPGAFVEAHIKGKTVENAIRIPREGITGGKNAWKVNSDSTLVKFDFQRLWGTTTDLIVKVDEEGSFNLALNLPQAPVSGMKVTPMIIAGGKDE